MKKIVISLFIFLLCACSMCKVAQQSPIQEIQFGNGGGFTGGVTTFYLKADGSLWKHDQMLKKLSCDSLNAIYDLAEQLPHEDFIHPGNTYSFIKFVSHDATYYYTWTWEDKPKEIFVELYSKLSKQL